MNRLKRLTSSASNNPDEEPSRLSRVMSRLSISSKTETTLSTTQRSQLTSIPSTLSSNDDLSLVDAALVRLVKGEKPCPCMMFGSAYNVHPRYGIKDSNRFCLASFGNFQILPNEIIYEIFSYLSTEALFDLRNVSRAFYHLTNNPTALYIDDLPSGAQEGWLIDILHRKPSAFRTLELCGPLRTSSVSFLHAMFTNCHEVHELDCRSMTLLAKRANLFPISEPDDPVERVTMWMVANRKSLRRFRLKPVDLSRLGDYEVLGSLAILGFPNLTSLDLSVYVDVKELEGIPTVFNAPIPKDGDPQLEPRSTPFAGLIALSPKLTMVRLKKVSGPNELPRFYREQIYRAIYSNNNIEYVELKGWEYGDEALRGMMNMRLEREIYRGKPIQRKWKVLDIEPDRRYTHVKWKVEHETMEYLTEMAPQLQALNMGPSVNGLSGIDYSRLKHLRMFSLRRVFHESDTSLSEPGKSPGSSLFKLPENIVSIELIDLPLEYNGILQKVLLKYKHLGHMGLQNTSAASDGLITTAVEMRGLQHLSDRPGENFFSVGPICFNLRDCQYVTYKSAARVIWHNCCLATHIYHCGGAEKWKHTWPGDRPPLIGLNAFWKWTSALNTVEYLAEKICWAPQENQRAVERVIQLLEEFEGLFDQTEGLAEHRNEPKTDWGVRASVLADVLRDIPDGVLEDTVKGEEWIEAENLKIRRAKHRSRCAY